MKKLIAIIVLLVLAGGGTYWYYNYGKPKEKPQILTATLSRQNIVEMVQATGALEAQRLVNVGSQVSGIVKSLHADYNDIVTEGKVIAELDPALLQVQVEIADANIARSENDIEQQKVQLQNDQLNLERMQLQYDRQMASKQQLEQAQLTVKSRKASIASAEKGITQQRASLAQAKLNVDYCTIKAPVTGVIVERKVDVGQAVQSSMTVAQFFTIATDLTKLKLTSYVDEADIGKVRAGMPVTFTVESYGAQPFSGTVDAVRLNATNTNNVVTYPVWISVPNNDLKLRPSMTASVRIIISTAEDVLRIPNGALRFKPNKEIYNALGLVEPAAGQGRRLGDSTGNTPAGDGRPGGQGANANAQQTAAGAPGAAGSPDAIGNDSQRTRTPGQMAGGQQAGGRGNGGGRGGNRNRNAGFAQGQGNFTPEQMARMQSMAGRNGRGGGAGRNQTSGNTSGNQTPLAERHADKIDELFSETPRIIQTGQVYTWDEAKKELKSYSVRYGVTDGQFSELVSSNPPLEMGTALVTNVILPQVVKPGQMPGGQNPFMGGPQRGPGGGMTPGGGGGGGGGGRGGGGGGGGGRGGGN
jgi:HlyD family secretion protein